MPIAVTAPTKHLATLGLYSFLRTLRISDSNRAAGFGAVTAGLGGESVALPPGPSGGAAGRRCQHGLTTSSSPRSRGAAAGGERGRGGGAERPERSHERSGHGAAGSASARCSARTARRCHDDDAKRLAALPAQNLGQIPSYSFILLPPHMKKVEPRQNQGHAGTVVHERKRRGEGGRGKASAGCACCATVRRGGGGAIHNRSC